MKLLFAEFMLVKGFLQPIYMTVLEMEYSNYYKKDMCHINEYPVDYSRKYDELMIKNAGCGGKIPLEVSLSPFVDEHHPVIYYADADDVIVKVNGVKGFRLDSLPPCLVWMLDKDKWNGIGDNVQPARAEVDDTLYCSVCNDSFPDTMHCNHIFWSPKWAWWAGCGADEFEDTCMESLFEFLKHLGRKRARKIRRVLASHSYNIYKAMGGSMYHDPLEESVPEGKRDVCEDGYEWLRSLESGVTTEADILTCKWITEWLARRLTMYCHDGLVDGIALEEIKKWASKVHREVCLKVCVANPNVFTAQKVIENAKLINAIPEDEIKKVTRQDLEELGCYL